MLPNDTLTPKETSGLRIGFAAITTRGCNQNDAKIIAKLIDGVLSNKLAENYVKNEVSNLTKKWLKIEEI